MPTEQVPAKQAGAHDSDAAAPRRADVRDDRDELILQHLPQVKLIARKIHNRLPGSVNLDDLISTGILGLIAAIDRFDRKHDVKLKTYAEHKIRGAILDSLRSMDWAPRLQRRRLRLIETAVEDLERQLQRLPVEEEVARHLGISVAEYQEWLANTRCLSVGSLEYGGGDDDAASLLCFIADGSEKWPSEIALRRELERALEESIETMPEVERLILTLYFYEELTLREIAEVLRLHESRISQLKSQAILRLRWQMKKRGTVGDQPMTAPIRGKRSSDEHSSDRAIPKPEPTPSCP
jgi:RNA polymerase sigma factor FliA